ncbi:hypothetical protein T01_1279 [Trichinella spiralis]|uniref:Uncharacterized protein n=1 Tax=Trichinella spiralis TaxID=6334 RepID=A0A0V1ALT8_TRISP|nr:hypothetical protein T01_1279 [Trichinella spiralis]
MLSTGGQIVIFIPNYKCYSDNFVVRRSAPQARLAMRFLLVNALVTNSFSSSS